MECPNCRLINPEGNSGCDCGYNFVTRETGESHAAENERNLGSTPDFGFLLVASICVSAMGFYTERVVSTSPVPVIGGAVIWIILFLFGTARYGPRGLWLSIGAPFALGYPLWWLLIICTLRN